MAKVFFMSGDDAMQVVSAADPLQTYTGHVAGSEAAENLFNTSC